LLASRYHRKEQGETKNGERFEFYDLSCRYKKRILWIDSKLLNMLLFARTNFTYFICRVMLMQAAASSVFMKCMCVMNETENYLQTILQNFELGTSTIVCCKVSLFHEKLSSSAVHRLQTRR
jgi:hypothetical protein